ncbi:hypothetical protein Mterra_01757 [Calidithermus terrae]|uniref:Protein TolB n=1 Tax=Calidithermus terrae TaxID=1408545 RepID=A0A399EMS1_9DEIN|nr:hypothetical protein [Calidithermus terrae]RIH85268.1 hypothetical protein Mterra_01757 [Calidithermus terrae]
MWGLALSSRGDRAAFRVTDGKQAAEVVVYDLAQDRKMYSLPSGVFGDLTFSPDGTLLIAKDGKAKGIGVYEAASGRRLAFKPGWVDALAYSPNKGYVAYVRDGSRLEVWDYRANRVIYTTGGNFMYQGNTVINTGLVFSPDGSRLALGTSRG